MCSASTLVPGSSRGTAHAEVAGETERTRRRLRAVGPFTTEWDASRSLGPSRKEIAESAEDRGERGERGENLYGRDLERGVFEGNCSGCSSPAHPGRTGGERAVPLCSFQPLASGRLLLVPFLCGLRGSPRSPREPRAVLSLADQASQPREPRAGCPLPHRPSRPAAPYPPPAPGFRTSSTFAASSSSPSLSANRT